MEPLSEQELNSAAESAWSEYEGLLTKSFKGIFVDAYKQGYAKCVEQMLGQFNNLLDACNTAIQQKSQQEEYLTIVQACDFLSVSKMTLYRWEREKIIESVKLGGRKYYRRSDIEKAMNNPNQEGGQENE